VVPTGSCLTPATAQAREPRAPYAAALRARTVAAARPFAVQQWYVWVVHSGSRSCIRIPLHDAEYLHHAREYERQLRPGAAEAVHAHLVAVVESSALKREQTREEADYSEVQPPSTKDSACHLSPNARRLSRWAPAKRRRRRRSSRRSSVRRRVLQRASAPAIRRPAACAEIAFNLTRNIGAGS